MGHFGRSRPTHVVSAPFFVLSGNFLKLRWSGIPFERPLVRAMKQRPEDIKFNATVEGKPLTYIVRFILNVNES